MQERKQIIFAARPGNLAPPFHCVDFSGDACAQDGVEFINPGAIYRANERAWRAFFVDWLGGINVRNACLDWWAYTSTAKNMLSSDLGNRVFQLFALREIVLADGFQTLCVVGASKEQVAIFSGWLRKIRPEIQIGGSASRPDAASASLFIPFRLLFQLASVWLGFRHAPPTRPEPRAEKTICFFTYIDNVLKPGADIYFGPLEALLKQRWPDLNAIYAAYVYTPYRARLRELRQLPGKYLPLFAQLGCGDLLWVLFKSLAARRVGGYELHTTLELDMGLGPLLRQAMLKDAGFGDYVFNLLVYRGMIRFAREHRPAKFVYPFENKSLEKMLLLALRQVCPAAEITGYQHTSITPRHTTLLFTPGEAAATPLPDRIVTVGAVTRAFLESDGNYPPGIFRTGCALRQARQESPQPIHGHGGIPKILLALSSSTRELVGAVQFFKMLHETGATFALGIRPHPEFPLGNLPPALIEWCARHARDFSGSPLADNLAWCDLTAYVSSTVALETLMAGKPVINFCIDDVIQPDPVIGDAPLHWRAENPVAMVRVLQQIEALPAADFQQQSTAARAYIDDYLRPVSADCVTCFVDDTAGKLHAGMSGATAPVALIIPILNEAETLPSLLHALAALDTKPAELIFVDAGCRDASVHMINDWWQSGAWDGTRLTVVAAPDAYPGGARNAGIGQATQPWIAFLDAGISPDSHWLGALMRAGQAGQAAAIFGVTRFTGRDALTTALCALSYGQGAARSTLPGSMFRRETFERAGKFDPGLRAGEDLLWLRGFHQLYPQRTIESEATALYFHFPPTLAAAAEKWFAYERHAARAGINNGLVVVYLVALSMVAAAFALNTAAGLALCLLYFLARGIADPVRRSGRWDWWRGHPASFLLAPFCAVVIDAAKFAGRIRGTWEKARA